MLSTHSTVQGFGQTYFSRTRTLKLKRFKGGAKAGLDSYAAIKKNVVTRGPGDSMLILHRSELPHDILMAFTRASLGANGNMNFVEDLKNYADFAAFCSFIEERSGRGRRPIQLSGLVMFNDASQPVSRSKDARRLFGDQFDQLANRTIFVSLSRKIGLAGPLSLSVNLARQLGTLKLETESTKLGFPGEKYSDHAVHYFSTAYALLFAKYLMSKVRSAQGQHNAKDIKVLTVMLYTHLVEFTRLEAQKGLGSELNKFLLSFGTEEEDNDESIGHENLTDLRSVGLVPLSSWPSAWIT